MITIMILDIILIISNIIMYYTDQLVHIDKIVYNSIAITDVLTPFYKLITSFSNTLQLCVIVILTILFLIKIKKKKEAINVATVFCFSAILMQILKWIFQRNRPDVNRLIEISGFSYPSGHSLMSFVFYGLLIYLINKNYKGKYKKIIIAILASIIVLIGFSRIYLGVHYFTDVILGYSIALLILIINSIIIKKNEKKQI